jgi:UPF0716 protein FxsA
MGFLILLLLVALPLVELVVIIQVGAAFGALNAIGLLILFTLVGGWLAKREGLGIVNRMRRAQEAGEAPSKELTDAALILLAGGLFMFPGFVTDAMGLLLLIPPIRIGVRTLALRQLRARGDVIVVRSGGQVYDDGIWEADSWEEPPRRGELDGGSP